MARSPDPVVDLDRCAEHIDGVVLLLKTVVGGLSLPETDMLTGLAERIRDNTNALRAGTTNSSDALHLLPEDWRPLARA